MIKKLLTAPLVEPVSKEELIHYARIDSAEEDSVIEEVIEIARVRIENFLNRKLIKQKWQLFFGREEIDFSRRICMPFHGLLEIIDFQAILQDESEEELEQFILWKHLRPEEITLQNLPTGTRFVKLEADFGYGATAADIPATLKKGILMLATELYENKHHAEITEGIKELIHPEKVYV